MSVPVIVGGIRTPFVRTGDVFNDIHALELGRLAVRELLDQFDLHERDVMEVVVGNVATPPDSANIARIIAMRAGIPKDRIAHTVSRNCASGMEAITQAHERIAAGLADCIVAVGVDSMSNIPVFWKKSFAEKLFRLARSRTLLSKLKAMSAVRPRDLAPQIGLKLGLTDPISGMIMGKTAEKLAREYGVSREEQDAFALRSHQRAVEAWQTGRLRDETMTVYPAGKRAKPVSQDVGPRAEQDLAKLGKLKPYFDRKWGSVTVGNACGVTDGAVAVLLMSDSRARALGYEPLGTIRAHAYAGCDPDRMGLGPVYSSALALQDAGLRVDQMELVEINEAFAAQVMACQRAFEKPPADCADGAAKHLGAIADDRLNVNGGAIALGHPVGASGARIVLTLLHELKRRGDSKGLATLCVGGGQGGAVVVDRECV